MNDLIKVTHLMGGGLLPACGDEEAHSFTVTPVLGNVTCEACRALSVVPYAEVRAHEAVADAEATLSAIFDAAGEVRAIALEVVAERARQDAKWGAPHDVPNGTGAGMTLLGHHFGELRRMMQAAVDYNADRQESIMSAILLEEVFEALAESSDVHLRMKLIQVAAVAAKWVQIIDARGVRS